MKKGPVTEVPYSRWKAAQEAELYCWSREPLDSEDWNAWWSVKFSNYDFLSKHEINSIYEVGCGPYAKNIEHIFKAIGKIPDRVIIEDPLMQEYLSLGKSVKRFLSLDNAVLIPLPLEEFTFKDAHLEPVDLVICNNVLDHVRSVDLCFKHIFSALKPGGLLILGQDLTNEEDEKNHPGHDDIMHPIMIDEEYLSSYLAMYETIKHNVLAREEGRNPGYHCGTLLFVGRKPEIE